MDTWAQRVHKKRDKINAELGGIGSSLVGRTVAGNTLVSQTKRLAGAVRTQDNASGAYEALDSAIRYKIKTRYAFQFDVEAAVATAMIEDIVVVRTEGLSIPPTPPFYPSLNAIRVQSLPSEEIRRYRLAGVDRLYVLLDMGIRNPSSDETHQFTAIATLVAGIGGGQLFLRPTRGVRLCGYPSGLQRFEYLHYRDPANMPSPWDSIATALNKAIAGAVSNGTRIDSLFALPDALDATWKHAWLGRPSHLLGVAAGGLHRPPGRRSFVHQLPDSAFALATVDNHMLRGLIESKIDEISLPGGVTVDKASIVVDSRGVVWTMKAAYSESKSFDLGLGSLTVKAKFSAKADMAGQFVVTDRTELFFEYSKTRVYSIDWSTSPIDISGIPGIGDFIDDVVAIGIALASASLGGSKRIAAFDDVDRLEVQSAQENLKMRLFKS